MSMIDTDTGHDPSGQALVNDAPAGHRPSGFDPSRGFHIKRWCVTVDGYGTGFYDAPTRGAAMADAWRCDAFSHITFGQFLRMARCRRLDDLPARWGDPIIVGGKPAFFLESNRQYVRFAYPEASHASNAHPYDVLPVVYRPDTYRDRDSDENPKGEDGTASSRSDDSAGRKASHEPDRAALNEGA